MFARPLLLATLLTLAVALPASAQSLVHPLWTQVELQQLDLEVTPTADLVLVRASFTLHNTGPETVFTLGHPLGNLETAWKDFSATIDGTKVDKITEVKSRPPMGAYVAPASVGGEAYRFPAFTAQWNLIAVPLKPDQTRTVLITYSIAPTRVTTAEHGDVCAVTFPIQLAALYKNPTPPIKILLFTDKLPANAVRQTLPAGSWQGDRDSKSLTLSDTVPLTDFQLVYKPQP